MQEQAERIARALSRLKQAAEALDYHAQIQRKRGGDGYWGPYRDGYANALAVGAANIRAALSGECPPALAANVSDQYEAWREARGNNG